MQKICREIRKRLGMRGHKSILIQQRGSLSGIGKLFRQIVHLRLQHPRVVHHADACIPGIFHRTVVALVERPLPALGIGFAKLVHDLLCLGMQTQVRPKRGQNQDVFADGGDLPARCRCVFQRAIGNDKSNNVNDDQRQRDDRPAPRRHILVSNWEEHAIPLPCNVQSPRGFCQSSQHLRRTRDYQGNFPCHKRY